ncbi:TSUP family transporter [Halpernia frigidisoli]|uniref:Probable membrane transporter protein n=1 Tax=Halpernia frigidisoli TaxID=1125876 RepID=A0A1I3DKB7_9FLAO|nr:TSUP family transporter [Halpernia frigidisoli]SFH87167.1 hypothetical protein SAMN05443292_0535 [Halpernia frigidisoli]
MKSKNSLFPIYLNSENLNILIIGGDKNDLNFLNFLIKNYSTFHIKIVFPKIDQEIKSLAEVHNFISIFEKEVDESDFKNQKLIFVTESEKTQFHYFKIWSKENFGLIHFINSEEKSDFETEFSNKNFDKNTSRKVSLVDPYKEIENTAKIVKRAKLKANLYLGIIGVLVFFGLFFLTLQEFNLFPDVKLFFAQENHIFLWMVLVGFLAEMIAGSMGMGYGVICTTILLLLNIPPPIVSASIHSAESFTTAAGSISHFKLKNVNLKLVFALAPFAIIGAIIGAVSLSYFGEHYAKILKPIISVYTLYLGANILRKTLAKKSLIKSTRKRSNLKVLGIVGGFIDSFAGGGWGPLVTGSLIKDGRTPRYVVGSSTVAKFLLTITSAVTFIFTIGIHHWNIILGLLLGGVVTAPFSAMLTSRLPVRKMSIAISILVIVMSLVNIFKILF